MYSSTIVCVNQHKPLQLGTEIRKIDCQMTDFFELTKSFGLSASWRVVWGWLQDEVLNVLYTLETDKVLPSLLVWRGHSVLW